MLQILQVIFRRLAYPEHMDLEPEPEGTEAEYQLFREDLIVLYNALARIKPLHEQLVQ